MVAVVMPTEDGGELGAVDNGHVETETHRTIAPGPGDDTSSVSFPGHMRSWTRRKQAEALTGQSPREGPGFPAAPGSDRVSEQCGLPLPRACPKRP